MCAIRGYHYHRRHWTPVINETLKCLHDEENTFDVFAIKACKVESFETVGHLPREISRATKFLLDTGAVVNATVSSNNYRRSPLDQGGLEISCKVSVTMPAASMKNIKILEKYISTVQELYMEPEQETIMGSVVFNSFPSDVPQVDATKSKNKTNPKKKGTIISQDIRTCFTAIRKKQENEKEEKKRRT